MIEGLVIDKHGHIVSAFGHDAMRSEIAHMKRKIVIVELSFIYIDPNGFDDRRLHHDICGYAWRWRIAGGKYGAIKDSKETTKRLLRSKFAPSNVRFIFT